MKKLICGTIINLGLFGLIGFSIWSTGSLLGLFGLVFMVLSFPFISD